METIDSDQQRFVEQHIRRKRNENVTAVNLQGRTSRRLVHYGVKITAMHKAFAQFAGEGKWKTSDFDEAMKRQGFEIGTIVSKGQKGWAVVELI